MNVKNCDGCGKEIYVSNYKYRTQKYHFCDKTCYRENIGKYFTGKNNGNYKRVECTCAHCGMKFLRKPSQIRGKKSYCSNTCHTAAIIETPNTPRIRVVCSCDNCGASFERTPAQISGKKNLYCSMECKDAHASVLYSGENHPCYKPEISDEERIAKRKFPAYFDWRNNVYERDSYTCRCCNDAKGGNLAAHHIYNYSQYREMGLDIDNGITLCSNCHKNFHDKYGYTSNNLRQLIDFFVEQGGDATALFVLEGTLIPSQAC